MDSGGDEGLDRRSHHRYVVDTLSTESLSDRFNTELLDTAERALDQCIKTMNLPAKIVRKARAVGIVPAVDGEKFQREQLEETVMVTQKMLEMSEVAAKIPFCAFNGTLLSLTTLTLD